MLEQHPGLAMHDAATNAGKDTMFLVRVTHSSGMLEGKYTAETTFPPTDHRSHRPRSWLLNGVKKVEKLRFLENSERTLGQAALQWLLADNRVASTLPNIYNEEQLVEFAKAPECPSLTADYLFALVNFFENIGNHWGSCRAAVDFAADVAFVECCECISRLISWYKPREPCRSALFVFGSPLCRASFSGDLSIIEAGLMRGAARAIHNVDHSRVQFVQRLGRQV